MQLKKTEKLHGEQEIGSVITIMHLLRHDATRPDT
jgi:hypothetical protein